MLFRQIIFNFVTFMAKKALKYGANAGLSTFKYGAKATYASLKYGAQAGISSLKYGAISIKYVKMKTNKYFERLKLNQQYKKINIDKRIRKSNWFSVKKLASIHFFLAFSLNFSEIFWKDGIFGKMVWGKWRKQDSKVWETTTCKSYKHVAVSNRCMD